MDISLIVLIAGAVFAGALMRSTFGFGDSVISMPLLALLLIPFTVAVALIGLTGLTTALFSVISGWKDRDPLVIRKLTVATLIDIPCGLILVQFAPQSFINLILGTVLFLYSLYSLTASVKRQKYLEGKFENANYAYPFGFLSGMLGSAYNMNGIPIVLYAATRDWSPRQFLGTVQSHFIISSSFIVMGQFFSGFWTKELGVYYIFSVPALLIAMYLGRLLYRKIDADKFRHYIFIMILILGVINILDGWKLI